MAPLERCYLRVSRFINKDPKNYQHMQKYYSDFFFSWMYHTDRDMLTNNHEPSIGTH